MRPLRTVIAVEGSTDETFFRGLLDRALQEIGRTHPGNGFDVAQPVVLLRAEDTWRTVTGQIVAQTPAPSLVFFHYDGTSRPEREAAKNWEPMVAEWTKSVREPILVPLVPVREMESWALADLDVINGLAGVDVARSDIFEAQHLTQVEKLSDPKRTLSEALRSGTRRRRRGRSTHDYLALIAEKCDLARLGTVPSFCVWRTETVSALKTSGFIE